jgi:cyclopropane-fatty-acyl-phospholipid synthase
VQNQIENTQVETAKYYSRIGSRLGNLLVMRRSQHFGYYDKKHKTEKSAQDNYHEKFSELLRLKPGMVLLDAGCGQGVVACCLAKNFNVNVTGITIAKHEVKMLLAGPRSRASHN